MSVPIVNFDFTVDMSGNGVTATATNVPMPANLPVAYLQLDCSKTAFFGSSGFSYTVTTNASGVVTAVTAQASTNVNNTHITTNATSASTWKNGNMVGNVVDMSFNYLSNVKTVKYNLANSNTLAGADLAKHIMLMVTHALQVKSPTTLNDVFNATEFSNAVSSLKTNIGNVIKTALSTQACQDAIFQAFLTANGPVINTTSGSYTIAYSASHAGMVLAMNITQMPVTVTYYGVPRTVTVYNIPLFINLS